MFLFLTAYYSKSLGKRKEIPSTMSTEKGVIRAAGIEPGAPISEKKGL